jgi:hypothetical protein
MPSDTVAHPELEMCKFDGGMTIESAFWQKQHCILTHESGADACKSKQIEVPKDTVDIDQQCLNAAVDLRGPHIARGRDCDHCDGWRRYSVVTYRPLHIALYTCRPYLRR